jgi:hypothetical protein
MRPLISLLVCLAATALFAWEPPQCPANLVKYLPAGETYWSHATDGTIIALASRKETSMEIWHHLTIINEAENKVYQVYEMKDKGALAVMNNYDIFNIRIISRTEIEYSVEDAGITMVYHVQWNDKHKKYIQDGFKQVD